MCSRCWETKPLFFRIARNPDFGLLGKNITPMSNDQLFRNQRNAHSDIRLGAELRRLTTDPQQRLELRGFGFFVYDAGGDFGEAGFF